LALVFLLVPSTAMGLTLPLLARALVALDPNFGTVLGRLYGWNTLGAVAGALLAETHLVAALGIRGSAYAAGSLNLIAAAGGWVAARSLAAGEGAATPERAPAPRWRGAGTWLGAAFLSGFALLALEVVWFRFLLLFVMGSSLSFAVMLAVVLSGIASGGLVASVWLRADPAGYRYAPLLALAAGLLCTASYAAFPAAAVPLEGVVVSGFRAVLGVSLPLMFPVSLLSGTFFTLAGAALHRGYPSAATATGVLTFANTTGAALGALAGGFLLLPLLGMEGSFFALTLLYGGIGLLVSRGVRLPRRLIWPVTGAFLLGAALFPFGAMVGRHLRTAAARWSGGEWRVVALREGVSETVLYVEELTHGKPRDLRLVTNSLSMSSTEFHIRRYMKLYVYLPVAIHPEPRRALLVSYGVGSTAKALTETRSLEEIDVVDISKDVLGTSSVVFPDPDENPLHDARVTVHVEDGRYFMRTTEKTFDLITGEPPPPQIANVVNLYTREYFALMRDRLREGGFVTYWLPLHSLSDRS
ncbi:MAG TPA: fused MFS/spermidine synthase, partial [Candidatus Thermoplasmatota archaeon]